MKGDKGNLTMFFHHKKETNRVVIELNIGDLPTLTVEMTPDSLFRLVDAVVATAVPFIQKVKENLTDDKGEDIKAELNTEGLDKLMKMREQYEQDKD